MAAAKKVPYAILAATMFALLGAGGWWVTNRALEAWTWLEARDDPAALSTLALKTELTTDRLQNDFNAALDAEDVDLASSYLELAAQQGMLVAPALPERYRAATSPSATARRSALEFYEGARSGEGVSGAGIAGVVVSDLTGIGDVRDLIHEGQKMARGVEPDHLVLGLAAVGLIVTGATIASVGAALPARAGMSTIKVAARTGRISKPLAAQLGRIMNGAIDAPAVRTAATAAARFDLAAARAAVRDAVKPAAFVRLQAVAGDVATITRRAGVRGAHEAMTIAQDAAELRSIARLAETRGLSARAILKVLGRGAITLGAGVVVFAGWMMAAVSYFWIALLVILAILKRAVRMAAWTTRQVARASRASQSEPRFRRICASSPSSDAIVTGRRSKRRSLSTSVLP